MEKLIGVGIIGTGVGIRTFLPGMRRTGRAEIVALSARTQERAEEVGGPLGIPLLTDDYHRLCEDDRVDLIVVASPNDLHVAHASAALATGKHVYLEKPTGVDAEQARVIADQAKSGDRIVVVGHQLRFNPYLRAMRNAIRARIIGRVYHLSIIQHGSGLGNPNQRWTWEFDPERGGGVRLAMGSHMVDLSRYLLGAEAVAIAAQMDPVFRIRTPEGGPERECWASCYFGAAVTFQDADVHMTTTAAAHSQQKFDVVAYGETGDLTFDLSRRLLLHRSADDSTQVLDAAADEEYRGRKASSIFSGSFPYFANELVDAILSGRRNVPDAATVDDAVQCMTVLDAALASGANGTREKLSDWDSRPYF